MPPPCELSLEVFPARQAVSGAPDFPVSGEERLFFQKQPVGLSMFGGTAMIRTFGSAWQWPLEMAVHIFSILP